ncbi:hypothetical protein MASR2M117_23420 [Paludibacter sp.]
MSIFDFFKNKENIKQSLGQSKSDNTNRPIYTPEHIDSLLPNEVFVFGSNLAGHHGGGAARVALNKFGAIYGQGIGMQGQSYAIPTMQGGVETIKPYVDDFIEFAKTNQHLFFFVTRIGCGIAGFRDEEMAPLFKKALELENVVLPKSFVQIIKEKKIPESYIAEKYGQSRTLADIIKSLNDQHHYSSIKSLRDDLYNVIEQYRGRGSVTSEAILTIESLLFEYQSLLFRNGTFDYVCFEQIFANKEYVKDKIDSILKSRPLIVFITIIKTINKHKPYTSASEIIKDLERLISRGNYQFNKFYHDTILVFMWGLEKRWDEITKDGVLDNELFEKVIFNDYETKIKELGIDTVIKMDYEENGCHKNNFHPKKIGAGPFLIKQNDGNFIKACGQGMNIFSSDNLYEHILDWLYE